MNEDNARLFLKALGAKQIQKKDKNWITASCPLAKWTHKGGKDSSPSFGLSIKKGERSHFHCYACESGSAGKLIQLVQLYGKNENPDDFDFLTAFKLADDEASELPLLSDYTEFGDEEQNQVFEPWDEMWLDSFKYVAAIDVACQYLIKRRVPIAQWSARNLRYDSSREMIVFPYYDVNDSFAGARGRSIHDELDYRHHDYTYLGKNNAGLVWYNEQCLELPGPVVVVEGQFDCLRVLQSVPKCVANLTAKPSPQKLSKLVYADAVILIPDNDSTGEKSVRLYESFLRGVKVPLIRLALDPEVKDAGECHPDYLRDLLLPLLKKF